MQEGHTRGEEEIHEEAGEDGGVGGPGSRQEAQQGGEEADGQAGLGGAELGRAGGGRRIGMGAPLLPPGPALSPAWQPLARGQ